VPRQVKSIDRVGERPTVFHVTLPINLTNRNDGQGHSWHRTAAEKKRIGAALNHLKREPFGYRVDLVITRILGKGQRLFDPDSIGRGNAKQLIDTLTQLGWWHDDSAKWIRHVDYRQDDTQRGTGPCVLIEIERVDE